MLDIVHSRVGDDDNIVVVAHGAFFCMLLGRRTANAEVLAVGGMQLGVWQCVHTWLSMGPNGDIQIIPVSQGQDGTPHGHV